MRHLMTVVEQLDRAASELSTDHPINNRLALILVDNATELIVHRRCMDQLMWHRTTASLTPKQRKMARGGFFGDKLKVINGLGDITQIERQFVNTAHHYRNELFHVGLRNDEIIRAISGEYYLLCCELFVRLKPGYRIQSSREIYTEVAKRYLPISDGCPDFTNVEVELLAEKLRGHYPSGIPDLAMTLGKSVRKSIEEIKDDLDFLIENNSRNQDARQVIKTAQWQVDFKAEAQRSGLEDLERGPDITHRVAQFKKALESTWKPRFSSFPRRDWMGRASAVELETDPLQALVMYQSLRNDMAYFENAIHASASELDWWIQIEIDRFLGK